MDDNNSTRMNICGDQNQAEMDVTNSRGDTKKEKESCYFQQI